MAQPMNRYKADLRELQFVLFEQLKLGDLLSKPPFEAWGPDEVKMVLDETYRFAQEVSGPLNQVGDEEGCRIEDGRVKTPKGFKEAWDKLYEAGWKSLPIPDEFGGQGSPYSLSVAAEEMLAGSNTAFSMYPGLTQGAADVIAEFGTDRQKKLYAQRLFDGKWGGTMCLTEPQAGSDVGAASSTAKKNDDGTYSIKGTKIFISGGDHDLAENIIHLVLARIDGALPGTKGLSLFIVPRLRANDDGTLGEHNDVDVPSIEHKLGINGSATCVINFGDNDKCVGELVGTVEHKGMRQMFKMMNFARIAVGIQGIGMASSAYLNALDYAKERTQGSSVKNWKDASAPRVPIIEHPNVRNMLLEMKAKVEGMRSLTYKLAVHMDQAAAIAGKDDEAAAYHQGQVELLTPLVKGYGSEQSFRVCEQGIQVFGGAGYLKDWPLEQYLRDTKILTIYEGTTSIQSMDLVGRKLGLAGGTHTRNFLGEIGKFVAAHQEDADLGPSVKLLAKAQEAVGGGAMQYMAWMQAGEMWRMPLTSRGFLEMMSELAVGWQLLDAATIALEATKDVADGHPDKVFYEGKKHTAIWFAQNVLPHVIARAKILQGADRTAVDMPEEAFATV